MQTVQRFKNPFTVGIESLALDIILNHVASCYAGLI